LIVGLFAKEDPNGTLLLTVPRENCEV
jgi:hypothetical protein